MHTATIKMGPVGRLEALAYTQRGLTPPIAVGRSYSPPSLSLAMLVPTHVRWFHRKYARAHRYFWIPCPRCGSEFGGHEVSTAGIPSIDEEDVSSCVCTMCSIDLEPEPKGSERDGRSVKCLLAEHENCAGATNPEYIGGVALCACSCHDPEPTDPERVN